jgi:hypothetical protein
MKDPTSTDEASIMAENEGNSPRMNDVIIMCRKVGTKTFPWQKAALNANHTPPPQDEDMPAVKKQRLETAVSAADDVGVNVAVALAVATHTSDTVTTDAPDNTVSVAPRDNATAAPLLNETVRASRAPYSYWQPEEDAELIDAVTKCCDNAGAYPLSAGLTQHLLYITYLSYNQILIALQIH